MYKPFLKYPIGEFPYFLNTVAEVVFIAVFI